MKFDFFSTDAHWGDDAVKSYIQYQLPKILDYVKTHIFSKKMPSVQKTESNFEKSLEDGITGHILEVYNWCRSIEFIRTGGKPVGVSEKTIDLMLSFDVKRLPSSNETNKKIQEKELLDSPDSYLILGDPGSGKTTTLKRIINRFILQDNSEKRFGFPLLIRFRDLEIGSHDGLFTLIAQKLGIGYETHKNESVIRFTERVEEDDGVGENGFRKYRDKIHERTKIVTTFSYTINNEDISNIIIDILEKNKALIILDGVDELNLSKIQTFTKDINKLKLNIEASKILITCRPGYSDSLSNFTICQICELDDAQIVAICNLHIGGGASIFLNQLNATSYKEFSNRPLFLYYLLILYINNRAAGLPLKAKDVYKELIDLFLTKWDKERGIVRKSKYSRFNNSQKQDFLINLAYYLTFEIKSKSFNREDLVKTYKRIHKRFNLPENEAIFVAEEIEDHTGIIISVFGNRFEFSHLALQEYLCSEYIAKTRDPKAIFTYLNEYPEPVAVALAHSFEPSAFFVDLVFDYFSKLEDHSQKDEAFVVQQLKRLLHRVLIEDPYFEEDYRLGYSILYLGHKFIPFEKTLGNDLVTLIKYHPNVKNSVRLALKDFVFNSRLGSSSGYTFMPADSSYRRYFNGEVKIPNSISRVIKN